MRAQFEVLRGEWTELKTLFEKAAEIATTVGPDRLIDISQSEDHNELVLTVWHWDKVAPLDKPSRRVRFQIFRSLDSRNALFGEVAQFISEIGPDRMICLSQSEDKNESIVGVWFWET